MLAQNNAHSIKSDVLEIELDCCPYCGNEQESLDINYVQPHLSSAPILIRHSTRTEAQIYLMANLAEVLSRDLMDNLEPLTGEVDHRYLSFALEDICNLNTALVSLYEILVEKAESRNK